MKSLAFALLVVLAGCSLTRAQVRETGFTRLDRVALAGFTTQREAWNTLAAATALSPHVPIGPPAQILTLFKRMLERGGPFQFIPETEQLASPAFAALAAQYPARAAFGADADLWSPPRLPFLPSEPSYALARQICEATQADGALWGRVRFELRSSGGYLGGSTTAVQATVEVVLFDAQGAVLWRDGTFAEGPPIASSRGFFAATDVPHAAQQALVSAMSTLLQRLDDRLHDLVESNRPAGGAR